MSGVVIRVNEGARQPVYISWDSVWLNDIDRSIAGCADWVIARRDPAAEVQDPMVGSFQANNPLETAIIHLLFNNGRRPDYVAGELGDRGGWAGDTFDIDKTLGEGPLGSLLWTLRRESLATDSLAYSVGLRAEDYCRRALQSLLDQKAITSLSVEATFDKPAGWLKIEISCTLKGDDIPYKLTVPFLKV